MASTCCPQMVGTQPSACPWLRPLLGLVSASSLLLAFFDEPCWLAISGGLVSGTWEVLLSVPMDNTGPTPSGHVAGGGRQPHHALEAGADGASSGLRGGAGGHTDPGMLWLALGLWATMPRALHWLGARSLWPLDPHLCFTGEALLVARAHLEQAWTNRWAYPALEPESLAHHAACLGWEIRSGFRPQNSCKWLSSWPALGKVRGQAGTVGAGFDVLHVGVRCGLGD